VFSLRRFSDRGLLALGEWCLRATGAPLSVLDRFAFCLLEVGAKLMAGVPGAVMQGRLVSGKVECVEAELFLLVTVVFLKPTVRSGLSVELAQGVDVIVGSK
jgi:hypothetical protein